MAKEEIQAVVEWYKRVPEEMKRLVAFRHEVAKDEVVTILYEAFCAAEKLSKEVRRSSKG